MRTEEINKTGIELISDERQRQIDVEGWTRGAACFATVNLEINSGILIRVNA